MIERVYTFLAPFGGFGAGALGFLRANAQVLGTDIRFRCLGGIDVDADACTDFERFTGVPALCADIRTLTPEALRAYAGETAPDVVFGSPPCKGSSTLMSEAKSREPKYVAMNELALVWMELMLRTWKTPPRLVLMENVPGIVRRGAAMLKIVRKKLRAAGYVIHEGTHDCGEIGGLAQHRRRWLLVARHPGTVPALLYQPIKRRVRAIGEVLGDLPLPGDPSAGPLHRLPKISWLTWIRLALIPAGGDWRHLPAQVGLPQRQNRHAAKFAVTDWTATAGCVTSATDVQTGAPNLADPRVHDAVNRGTRRAYENMYRVVRWTEPSKSVMGATRPGSGAASVADPRLAGGNAFANAYRVTGWDDAAGTVTAGTAPGSGGGVIADPRVHDPAKHSRDFNHHVYGIVPWEAAAHTIAGTSNPGNGPFSVADPRPQTCFHGAYGVTPWLDPGPTVRAFDHPSKGIASVADPRIRRDPNKNNFPSYGVLPFDAPSTAVTGEAAASRGKFAIADPRIPDDWKQPPADPPPVIIALDGTWHRPMTTLELAVLQGLPATLDGKPLTLTAKTEARRREHIGNAVPVGAAEAIARQMLLTLAQADAGVWSLSGNEVWVAPALARMSPAERDSLEYAAMLDEKYGQDIEREIADREKELGIPREQWKLP